MFLRVERGRAEEAYYVHHFMQHILFNIKHHFSSELGHVISRLDISIPILRCPYDDILIYGPYHVLDQHRIILSVGRILRSLTGIVIKPVLEVKVTCVCVCF